ncbi:MAG: hypothetical protein HY237_09480 [Acidobacteria bacterium]|nr:hypothetical protein [Acidobacteriota bacterium]
MLTQIRNSAGERSQAYSATRVVLLTAMVCAILLSAGCAGQTAMTNITPPPPSAVPPSAAVSFCDNPAPGCASANSFSVKSLGDLNVFVTWSNAPVGTHAQKLRFFLPNGNVYQAIETSFSVGPGANGTATTVRALPVAGTFISQRLLTGNWRVEVSLDDKVILTQAVRLDP